MTAPTTMEAIVTSSTNNDVVTSAWTYADLTSMSLSDVLTTNGSGEILTTAGDVGPTMAEIEVEEEVGPILPEVVLIIYMIIGVLGQYHTTYVTLARRQSNTEPYSFK